MNEYLLSVLLLVSSAVSATQIEQFAIMGPDEKIHLVRPEFVDKTLREIPAEKFDEALSYLSVRVVKMDNGEYSLKAHVKGFGGGPISAAAARTAVWAAYGALIATEGPLAALHFHEFELAAEAAYWGLFFVPWCP